MNAMTMTAHPLDTYDLCRALQYQVVSAMSVDDVAVSCSTNAAHRSSVGDRLIEPALFAARLDGHRSSYGGLEAGAWSADNNPAVNSYFSEALRSHEVRIWLMRGVMAFWSGVLLLCLYLLISAVTVERYDIKEKRRGREGISPGESADAEPERLERSSVSALVSEAVCGIRRIEAAILRKTPSLAQMPAQRSNCFSSGQ